MLEIAGLLGFAFLLCALLCRLVIQARVVDLPDGVRKVHGAPTPTSGGLAIGAAFGAALAAAALAPGALVWAWHGGEAGLADVQWAVAASFVSLVVGTVDDARPLDARIKLLIGVAVSFVFSLLVVSARYFPFGPGHVLDVGPIAAVLGSTLWVFTLQNSTNFMDGANGMAMGSIGIGLTGLAAVAASFGLWHLALVALLAAAALGGFLLWNFPAGKVFAGDAGALFVGALAAYLSLLLIREGGISPLVPPLLFFPTLADVLLTLLWRVRCGRGLLRPHRDHLYQIAIKSGWSHRKVSLVYWLLALHCAATAWLVSFSVRALPAKGLAGVLTWISALGPWLAMLAFAWAALHVDARVRRYAQARRLDEE